MRTAQQWLDEYALTHRNSGNKRLHIVCVPLIYWSVYAMLWSLGPRWAIGGLVAVLIFYLSLGWRYFLAMSAMSAVVMLLNLEMEGLPLAWIASGVFVAAWAGQFYGHKLEGKKPAFIDDLFFLLIGPLWILKSLKVLR